MAVGVLTLIAGVAAGGPGSASAARAVVTATAAVHVTGAR